ncbi:MAG TPA: hypothetical protein VFE53_08730 [Mucilaginibacter sp.]|jgi:hypothetical protein|nr:hypothetical protein [Mucilaginibacter sp.]
MALIKMDGVCQFAIETVGKKLRLVVYVAGVENVCRLETEKNIKKFIKSSDARLFKGRHN